MNNFSHTPLVSVCINAYNTEKYICQTLDSVFNQTYKNLQVIVVDDASTDNTVKVITEKFTDERLEIYTRKQNYHISYTCNEAIAYAKGKYVFHIDSDDVAADGLIEKQVSFLEANTDIAACFTRPEIIGLDGNIADSSYDGIRSLFTFKRKTQAEFVNQFFYNLNCLSHTGCMVRKSVLDEIGGHDGSMSYLHDFDLWTRIIIRYPIFVLEEPLAFYRMGDSINHSRLNEKSLNILNFEAACSVYRMINDCPDDLFSEAFHDVFKLQGPHTHEEFEIEKAFLLMNVNCMPAGNKLLGIMKFKELFREKKYVDPALEKFGFSIYDLLKHEEQKQFYDLSEIKEYIEKNKELQAKIEELQRRNNEYAVMADRYRKTAEFHARKAFHGIKHIKHFLLMKNNGIKYKKKVLLYGFYGMNLGDDLFFEAIINRYPDVLFLVLHTPEYYEFFNRYKNVKFYTYNSGVVSAINTFGNKFNIHDLFECLLLFRSNAVVHIGGSIYQQTENYLNDCKIRKRRSGPGKHYFSISSNFGPYHSDDFYAFWKKMFGKAYDICFRDTYSKELFPDVRSVRYAPDVLFSFKSLPTEVLAGSVSVSVIDPGYTYRNFSDVSVNAYKKAILNTIVALAEDNRTVNLLGFCKYEGDDAFIGQLLKELPDSAKKYVHVLNYDFHNKNEMIEALSSSEYIIGTRLHSVILGLAMGKKVLPIVYDNKTGNILTDIKYSGKVISLNDMPIYQNTGLSGLLKEIRVFKINDLTGAEDLQFEKLDEFLK